jgi:hypothetical protein
MKSFLSIAALCCAAALTGCSNNKTTDTASPGAMPECKCGEACKVDGKCTENCGAACCKPAAASPGAMGEKKSGCCSEAAKTDASMGAVGEKKSGCCSEAAKTDASMGAVGEKKSGCCAEGAKTDASLGAVGEKKEGCSSPCTGEKTDASMGAVSEKGTCTKTCPATGKTVS